MADQEELRAIKVVGILESREAVQRRGHVVKRRGPGMAPRSDPSVAEVPDSQPGVTKVGRDVGQLIPAPGHGPEPAMKEANERRVRTLGEMEIADLLGTLPVGKGLHGCSARVEGGLTTPHKLRPEARLRNRPGQRRGV
jgi:hypothetical protein